MKENQVFTHVIGVDIAKKTLDLALYSKDNQLLAEAHIANTKAKIQEQIEKWYKKYHFTPELLVICAENTGCYTSPLLNYGFHNQVVRIWVEHATRIKKCGTQARGMNDKMAARQIALYAIRYMDLFKHTEQDSLSYRKLRVFIAMRRRLVVSRQGHEVPQQELRTMDPETARTLEKTTKALLLSYDEQISAVDHEIKAIMAEDAELKRKYEILKSIPGIGYVVAATMLLVTKGFTRFENAKQFGCYCGVVPFEQTSGTSIRTRPKVSHQANKDMKQLIHLSALVAIRCNEEIKAYAARKLAQGKHKMSVINAVRNKLIHCAFSLIQRNQTFVPKEKLVPLA